MACEQLIELMQNNKNWVDYLSALLMPTIAILGSVIALQQSRINAKRLKHELFDRRYEQFSAIRQFLASIMTLGKSTVEEQQKYLIGTTGVRFIFDKEMEVYLHEKIWKLAIDLECLESELEGVPVGEERSQNVRKQRDIKNDLHNELRSLDDTFSKYLQLQH